MDAISTTTRRCASACSPAPATRDFCAGADVAAAAGGGFDDPPYPEVAEGLATKPVIAAIDGLCLGGGMMIATGCDLRDRRRAAEFGLPEARWNLPAQWLGALARQVAPAHALELALLADRTAARARACTRWDGSTASCRTGPRSRAALALGRAHRRDGPGGRPLLQGADRAGPAGTTSRRERLRSVTQQACGWSSMHDTVEGGAAFAERRPPKFEDA